MKYIVAFSFLLLSFSNFVCGMEPESPKSPAELTSPARNSRKSRSVTFSSAISYHRKEDSSLGTFPFTHQVEEVTIYAKDCPEPLTPGQKKAAVKARLVREKTKPRTSGVIASVLNWMLEI